MSKPEWVRKGESSTGTPNGCNSPYGILERCKKPDRDLRFATAGVATRAPIGPAGRAHKAQKVAGRPQLVRCFGRGRELAERTRKGEGLPTLGDRKVIGSATLKRRSAKSALTP